MLIAELTAPLRAIKSNAVFKWTEDCDKTYTMMKDLMASDKVLMHYDPRKPTKVYVDYSPHGVSATLAQLHPLQEEQVKWAGTERSHNVQYMEGKPMVLRPVTHVSRGLSVSEKNYAQIEGESLAILYGVMRLKRYLLGVEFTVAGDHKPLTPMYNQGRIGPMRVERHKIKLQGFTFNYTWEPGFTNPADYKSRHPSAIEEPPEDDEELCVYRVALQDLPNDLSKDKIVGAVPFFLMPQEKAS